MSSVVVRGLGAVSPAGWGADALAKMIASNQIAPSEELKRPGWNVPLCVRRVPAPAARPAFLSHPRLRRASPISHYTVHAALEALGDRETRPVADRIGVVLCVMAGSVNYSRRFYDETQSDPATASPLVFPETVFNSPASHLAALLGSRSLNYTLVGDPGTFLCGLALAAGWLDEGRVDGALIIGAEELDWLTADACHLFDRSSIVSEGAGAVYLERLDGKRSVSHDEVRLDRITNAIQYRPGCGPLDAARLVGEELPAYETGDQMFGSDLGRSTGPERQAWKDWSGTWCPVKFHLGEGLAAGSAWQCVAAVSALLRGECRRAIVSVVGVNQQAVGAMFVLGKVL